MKFPTFKHAVRLTRSAIVRSPLLSIEFRSGLYRLIAMATILSLTLGGLVSLPAAVDAAGATTTSALRLRAGPSTAYDVLTVIPEGATVEVTGDPQSGFYPVTYKGSSGFVSGDYLSLGGGGGNNNGGGTTGGPTGTRYVIDGALNLRSGPSTSDSVITVLRNGAAVELTGEQANGFAGVTYNGTSGWAFAQYLSANGGGNSGSDGGGTSSGGSVAVGDSVTGSATVFDGRLNLRRGPGTDYAVVTVMPNGASVELMGSAQSGFFPIRYSGTKGWASADYLNTGGGSAPQPEVPEAPPANNGSVPIGTQVTDNKVTTAALNLRSGPATSYGVVKVLPPGSKVDIMGSASGSFLPVRWAGYTGWAHGDWLGNVDSAPVPDPGTGQGSDIIQIIYAAADKWGQPRADMLRVARCESNLDPRAVNSSSGASGLFQFMPSTFAFTPNGKAGQNIFDPYASADAAGWMWANGMRNHWACQ